MLLYYLYTNDFNKTQNIHADNLNRLFPIMVIKISRYISSITLKVTFYYQNK